MRNILGLNFFGLLRNVFYFSSYASSILHDIKIFLLEIMFFFVNLNFQVMPNDPLLYSFWQIFSNIVRSYEASLRIKYCMYSAENIANTYFPLM